MVMFYASMGEIHYNSYYTNKTKCLSQSWMSSILIMAKLYNKHTKNMRGDCGSTSCKFEWVIT